MDCLADTNIHVRLTHRQDPLRRLAWHAVSTLWARGDRLLYTSQILAEYWNVCTRPATARGGLGLTVSEVNRRARVIERNLELLPDTLDVHVEWRRLLVAHSITGLQVHDARLVAAMHVYGITTLLTFDVAHFRRFPNITALHPQDV
jgi:predicted nucleic acid-binding protein